MIKHTLKLLSSVSGVRSKLRHAGVVGRNDAVLAGKNAVAKELRGVVSGATEISGWESVLLTP